MTAKVRRRSRAGDIAWMRDGACLSRVDLPWIADAEQTTAWDRLAMGTLCQGCPVLADCARHANKQKVTAGFWAGRHRDVDAPTLLAGPGWAIDPLPGLDGLGGAA